MVSASRSHYLPFGKYCYGQQQQSCHAPHYLPYGKYYHYGQQQQSHAPPAGGHFRLSVLAFGLRGGSRGFHNADYFYREKRNSKFSSHFGSPNSSKVKCGQGANFQNLTNFSNISKYNGLKKLNF